MDTRKKILLNENIDGRTVTVEQTGNILSLLFDGNMIESQIDLDAPDQLPLYGNRLMLSHLMFGTVPHNILLAGCGGGAIARWFNRVLPDSHGIAVESSSQIIQIARQQFDFPGKASNWRIIENDIRHFLQQAAEQSSLYDFILVDIEEEGQTPAWLIDGTFLENCQKCLSPEGVITFNIVAKSIREFARALWPVRQLFPQRTYCLASRQSQNVMICAFNYRPATDRLADKANAAKSRFDIEFDLFYQQLLNDNPPGSGIF